MEAFDFKTIVMPFEYQRLYSTCFDGLHEIWLIPFKQAVATNGKIQWIRPS